MNNSNSNSLPSPALYSFKKTVFITIFLLLKFVPLSWSQSNVEIALYKGREAIRLEDVEGKYDEAIKLFKEAEKLDPGSINYPYEIAYAYSSKKDYQKAAGILERLLTHKDVYGRIYQALGNAYDYMGLHEKALGTYEEGIKKFPASGDLYLELGNMKMINKEYEKALVFYEKGIEMDPKFPSNYYWASKIFCSSSEEVWGMIYGEIYMNLQPNNKRAEEISKLLFDTYKKQISLTSDTSFSVSFSKASVINSGDLKDSTKFKLPFGTGVYEMNLIWSVMGEKQIDINSLDRIRTRFVDRYFKGKDYINYPNILFDYQFRAKSDGHLEAYNHWVLMKGDEDGFKKWQLQNKTKWDNFLKWFEVNKMQVEPKHRFYRGQY